MYDMIAIVRCVCLQERHLPWMLNEIEQELLRANDLCV